MGGAHFFVWLWYTLNSQELAERVRKIAIPIVRSFGLDLVEVECTGHRSQTVVRVFIDRADGVSLSDCEHVHRSLSSALDVMDPIPYTYTLEVSSPGLDRPLKSREAFQRALGKMVRIKLRHPHGGQWSLTGSLLEVHGAGVLLRLKSATGERTAQPPTITIAWDAIAGARLEVEF